MDFKDECKSIWEQFFKEKEVDWDDGLWELIFGEMIGRPYYRKVCMNTKVSEQYILKFCKFPFDWRMTCNYQKMSERFMDVNLKNICWYYVLKYQDVSESWLRKHRKVIKRELWKDPLIRSRFSNGFIKEMMIYCFGSNND